MDKFVTKQYDLFKRIKATVENMKKLGAAKITKGVITSRLELLERNWNSFAETHEQLLHIFSTSDSESPYFKQDLIGICEEAYVEQKAVLLDFLDSFGAGTNAPVHASSSSLRSLPNIELPTFTGDYNCWPNFCDLFQSLIMNNKALSPVEKFHYLKTSLAGEPAQLLQNISVTSDSFALAWRRITERYQNLRVLINSQLTALMSLPNLKKESSGELKSMLNVTIDAVQALQALKRPVEHWDDWLVFITTGKLDPKTRMGWETSLESEPPTFEQLCIFLTTRLRALEAVEAGSSMTTREVVGNLKQEKRVSITASRNFKTHATSVSGNETRRCANCQRDHFILFCPAYKRMGPRERKQLVTEKGLCYNCLAPHTSLACKSRKRCQICSGKHHTSLHPTLEQSSVACNLTSPQVTGLETVSVKPSSYDTTGACDLKTVHCAFGSCSVSSTTSMVLATAELILESDQGRRISVRALIDPCSEVSLLEESIVQLLELPRSSARISVIGVGKTQTVTRGRELADPHFQSSRRINVILGADIYSLIIRSGLRQGPPDTPIAQATSLGWILTGPLRQPLNASTSQTANITALQCSVQEPSLTDIMTRFWKLEEVPTNSNVLTDEEKACEEHFRTTHSRDDSGRYVVRLPFKLTPTKLGNSKGSAISLHTKLERRLQRDSQLKSAYHEFLTEYKQLGHMEPVLESELPNLTYFLPHHGVLKESSSTTKLRVVFNASHKTSTGISLNNVLHKGPNLLPEIFCLLLRWRRHKVVFSADVEKMYRQIRVAATDCGFQCIVWRDSADEPLTIYKLLIVTYGMACSPYLAIRTLRQLSQDEGRTFPLAALCLMNDVYVDDVASGADTKEEASLLQAQLIELLRAGGFTLRKWASNEPDLLKNLPAEYLASFSELSCSFDNVSSLLGLKWNTTSDCFLITLKAEHTTAPISKRAVFSAVAGLYDPLGFLAPVVTQSLWLLSVNWDDPLPDQQVNYWTEFYTELGKLSSLRIPRWLTVTAGRDIYELHGFADASERAYAAVVYIKSISTQDGEEPVVNLVAAKTRVAPLKQISLPRLELCAATLVTRLMISVRDVLNLPNCSLHLWSDSTVVLSWLRQPPIKWKTFVANRVSEIQTALPEATWRHIRSAENPADSASRGLTGGKMMENQLWWRGPAFLAVKNYNLNTHRVENLSTEQEARAKVSCVTVLKSTFIEEFLERYSSISKLCRVTAWCLRFGKRVRNKSVEVEKTMALKARELHVARLTLIKCVQALEFAQEKTLLNQGVSVSRGPLLRLNPFLDSDGVLRVGGRLKHSLLDFQEKHPIILPSRGNFATLLIREAHFKTLHGGTQLTLGTLRQKYWLLCARRAVRTIISSCIHYWRWQAKTQKQQMADLPSPRVRPARPFINTGVDYAGPYLIKTRPGRGYRVQKAYVAVFICLATRAVHLELVSDYTADAFLAAYRRFVSRRGIASTLWSDQGTNFVGAERELRNLLAAAGFNLHKLITNLAQEGTTWRFNPPAAPHFGGIWEAAVRSMKHHLRRVVGDTSLTFEELTTVLCQIEACLNSRPLAPLDDDVSSYNFLTPGHFLIGTHITAIPEPSLLDEKIPRLSRWQLLSRMRDHFWKRWSAEYLQSLQARAKWFHAQPNVTVGDLCLVTSEFTPPTRWPIGRIAKTHTGDDGKVRVVDVRTPTTTITRPVTKICMFPKTRPTS